MKVRFLKLVAVSLALLMLSSLIAACNGNTPDTLNTPNEPDENTDLKVGTTFYPIYYKSSFDEYTEMRAKVKGWFLNSLDNNSLISANIGGAAINTYNCDYNKTITVDENGHEKVVAVYTVADEELEFRVEGTLYSDYPAVDYVVYLTNLGEKNSKKIDEFYAVDSTFPMSVSDNAYDIYTNIGSYERLSDFSVDHRKIEVGGEEEKFAPKGGSSSNDAWPFFRIEGEDEGVIMAVGWSGQWETKISTFYSAAVKIMARQQTFDAQLLPGECVRTPGIVLSYYDGDAEYGHNIWRRMMIEHYTPDDGTEERFVAPVSINFWGGRTNTSILRSLEVAVKNELKADLIWFDTAWYGDRIPESEDASVGGGNGDDAWHRDLGAWHENVHLFPNGIEEIGNYIDENTDYRFLLWWMIEDLRNDVADKATLGADSYYDNGAYGRVLRLDDDAVLEKLLDYFRMYIEEKGVDCIRLDKSASSYSSWEWQDSKRSVDETGSYNMRKGITENRYITNFYKLWDTLYEEYPDKFFLDNCCSGGRRIDIEMSKRSMPLWRTDASSYEAHQAMTQLLSPWVPLTAIGVARSTDPYVYRSYYSASTCVSGPNLNDATAAETANIIDEYVAMRPYWYGDYYQLLPVDMDEHSWQAYQLYREDLQEGMLVAVRRDQAEQDAITIRPRGLIADRKYLIRNIDDTEGKNDVVMTGKQLMRGGLSIFQPERSITVFQIKAVFE